MPGIAVVNQPSVELYNADGNPVNITQDGNILFISSRDEELLCVMQQILLEMKTMNLYLSIIVDNEDTNILLEDD